MNRVRRAGGFRATVVIAMGVAWLIAVPPIRAAEPSFGTPSIDGSFDKDVVVTQPVTLGSVPDRVEVLTTIADSPAPLVDEVSPPSTTGATTLKHTIAPAGGPFLPNTPVKVRWRITTDGLTAVGPEVRTVLADTRFEWQTVSGDIVRVHWYKGDRAFGERALTIGERAVKETAELLGVKEDQPVDFFIYADQGAFYDALGPGTRENVGGQANAEIRTLFAHIPPSSIDDPWVDNVVPHELTHLVFDTAVKNPYHFPPRWLNEGLAVYLSVGYEASDRSDVESAAKGGRLIPLDGLTAQFPTGAGFGLAYAESVSAVDFLVREHGRDALIQLIRSYKAGRTDDEAFAAAIGMDAGAFNDAWLADLKAATPKRYGPQPAPPGPVPQAWGGSAAPVLDDPVDAAGMTTVRTPMLLVLLALVAIGAGLLFWRERNRHRGPKPRSMVPGP
jgi:hypothetical protein